MTRCQISARPRPGTRRARRTPGRVVATSAAGADRGHGGGAGSHERVEHHVVLVGVELDEPSRQLDGEGRGGPTRFALSGGCARRRASRRGTPRSRWFLVRQALALAVLAPRARSKRPLLATTMRSLTSRSTGFAAEPYEPHAQDRSRPRPWTQTIRREGGARSSCRIVMTSDASDR